MASSEDRQLAAALAGLLVDEKTHRGLCSVWQLTDFLRLHAHPDIDGIGGNVAAIVEAVATALVQPRPAGE